MQLQLLRESFKKTSFVSVSKMLASKPIIVGYNQKVPEGKPSFLFVNAAGEQSTVGEVVEPSAGHTRIVVVGCTHGKHEEVCWPHGDILIHTGTLFSSVSFSLSKFLGFDTGSSCIHVLQPWFPALCFFSCW